MQQSIEPGNINGVFGIFIIMQDSILALLAACRFNGYKKQKDEGNEVKAYLHQAIYITGL
jgi:hypothetical protein